MHFTLHVDIQFSFQVTVMVFANLYIYIYIYIYIKYCYHYIAKICICHIEQCFVPFLPRGIILFITKYLYWYFVTRKCFSCEDFLLLSRHITWAMVDAILFC